jgi:hypothetical protein
MKRTRAECVAVVALLGATMWARDAVASSCVNQPSYFHGTNCYGVTSSGGVFPPGSASSPQLFVDQFGIHNASSSATNSVQCPLTYANEPGAEACGFISNVRVSVWQETSTAISCAITLTNNEGYAQYTNTQTASTAETSQWISWYPSGGGTYGTIECSLPPASGYSVNRVTAYLVQ